MFCSSPGVVDTEFWTNDAEGSGVRDFVFDAVTQTVPVGRVGKPNEIADAYLFAMKASFRLPEIQVYLSNVWICLVLIPQRREHCCRWRRIARIIPSYSPLGHICTKDLYNI